MDTEDLLLYGVIGYAAYTYFCNQKAGHVDGGPVIPAVAAGGPAAQVTSPVQQMTASVAAQPPPAIMDFAHVSNPSVMLPPTNTRRDQRGRLTGPSNLPATGAIGIDSRGVPNHPGAPPVDSSGGVSVGAIRRNMAMPGGMQSTGVGATGQRTWAAHATRQARMAAPTPKDMARASGPIQTTWKVAPG